MKVYVEGKEVTLTQSNFVAKGGEGQIFKKDNTAFKIYEDLTKMIPPAKIGELKELDHPSITNPKEIIQNSKKQYIGFTMDWLGDDMVALCKLFTNNFRTVENIDNTQIIELVENIKKTTQFIHSKNCLIVDGNELNYLVEKDYVTPHFIDVNSWKTKSFPATAIMPSVRDWRSNSFTIMTDWFSFAIVSFQLFVGVHPFKGNHPRYKKHDFVNRVKDCISVFNGQVSLPPTVRDFNLIPSSYKDWYYKLFEQGERIPPPVLPGTAEKVQVVIQVIKSTNSFDIELIKEYDGVITYYNSNNNIVRTQDKIYLNKTDYKVSPGVEVLHTFIGNVPILCKVEDNLLKLKCLTSGYTIKNIVLAGNDMMILDNILYLKNDNKLIEIDFKLFSTNIVPVIKNTWSVEPLSSKLFSNIVYQSVLGKAHFCIPLPNVNGSSSFIILPIKELDDHKVIEAKYENKVCMVITNKNNEYHRFVFIFNDSLNSYSCREINSIDYQPLNFTVLDNGVCVSITEENNVEIFLNRVDKRDIKSIQDPDIDNTMRLCKNGTTLCFFKDKSLYKMKMK